MTLAKSLSLGLLLAVFQGAQTQTLQPKMVSDFTTPSEGGVRSRIEKARKFETTKVAYIVEDCSPSTPVTFDVSGGNGKGAIGLVNNPKAQFSLSLAKGTVKMGEERGHAMFSALYVSDRSNSTFVKSPFAVSTPSNTLTRSILTHFLLSTDRTATKRMTPKGCDSLTKAHPRKVTKRLLHVPKM